MARKARELTDYSRKILDYLRQHESPIPPTRQEIAEALGMHASTVQNSLLQLKEFGHITIVPKTARGIILNEPNNL